MWVFWSDTDWIVNLPKNIYIFYATVTLSLCLKEQLALFTAKKAPPPATRWLLLKKKVSFNKTSDPYAVSQ